MSKVVTIELLIPDYNGIVDALDAISDDVSNRGYSNSRFVHIATRDDAAKQFRLDYRIIEGFSDRNDIGR